MKLRQTFPAFAIVFCFLASQVRAQHGGSLPQSIQRDPQALEVLLRSLNAAGGQPVVGTIEDYTASGKIIYFWGHQPVTGSVNLKGRGTGQFRLDAAIPTGVRSWAVSNGVGFMRMEDGDVTVIPEHNTWNYGSLTIPWFYVVKALNDSSMNLSYVGLEPTTDGQVYHVQTKEVFGSDVDPEGLHSKLTTRDFFVDAKTYRITRTRDMLHPKYQSTKNIIHEVEFSDYRVLKGVSLPFSINDRIGGQLTSTIQLAQIDFNTGLGDLDFSP